MKRNKVEEIGYITVDAGLVQIGDPCYQFENHDNWITYLEKNKILENNDDVHDIKHDEGHPGKALVVSSGYGDGVYPVFIERNKDGRIMSLLIDFDIYEFDEVKPKKKKSKKVNKK